MRHQRVTIIVTQFEVHRVQPHVYLPTARRYVIRKPFAEYVDANPAETDYASWGTADATSWLGPDWVRVDSKESVAVSGLL
jgi:hypothetical protein